MYGWNMSGYMGWGWLMPLLALGVIGFLLTRSRCHAPGHTTRQSPQDILDERFARGEIDESEYQKKQEQLQKK